MADIRADGIAVYVYRRIGAQIEFLQMQRSDQTGEYQGSWQIVYGGIEPGETAFRAALRELREEIGVAVPDLREMFQAEYVETFYFRPKDYVLLMPVFAAEVRPNTDFQLNEEHSNWRWIKAEDIESHFMWRTQREALRAILDEIHHPGAARRFLRVDLATER